MNETVGQAQARFVPRPGEYVEESIRLACPPDYTYVLEWEGKLCPISNMWDVYGDPTDAPAKAHTIVAYLGNEKWLTTNEHYPEQIVKRSVRHE